MSTKLDSDCSFKIERAQNGGSDLLSASGLSFKGRARVEWSNQKGYIYKKGVSKAIHNIHVILASFWLLPKLSALQAVKRK